MMHELRDEYEIPFSLAQGIGKGVASAVHHAAAHFLVGKQRRRVFDCFGQIEDDGFERWISPAELHGIQPMRTADIKHPPGASGKAQPGDDFSYRQSGQAFHSTLVNSPILSWKAIVQIHRLAGEDELLEQFDGIPLDESMQNVIGD